MRKIDVGIRDDFWVRVNFQPHQFPQAGQIEDMAIIAELNGIPRDMLTWEPEMTDTVWAIKASRKEAR